MDEAGRADDRLPWLETPRPAKSAKPRPAARRARTPLLLLLGLFLASAIAVMAFITGRSTAPVDPPRAIDLMEPAPLPAPEPVLVPEAPVAPIVAAPPPVSAAPIVVPATPRATRPKAKTSVRRPVERSRGVTIHRRTPRARVVPPRYRWPTPSVAGPSGRVVQLGAYYNGRQTMAAWRRLRRAYPYLATLPRKVTVVRPASDRPRYYRLRIGAGSAEQARAICDELHRIGRGCIVV